ncbi:hypothetical protein RM553_13090 [Zunongwangia sp. F363]|uniref:Uncharacterized protein n=1 Tax=Autumnicola tepida TaxID=3075595 RepID=A0ABU3CBR9_9FLAO|nr:hypothetical protein [Zunongwangia sp. F363]MDT0643771.1 hypothetical protein [Zunongwangia sp. F363]
MVITENLRREHIAATKMFRSLSTPMQQMTLKMHNILKIQEEISLATAVGLEAWEKITKTTYANRMIVQELLQKKEI